jgi:hypothetical protein
MHGGIFVFCNIVNGSREGVFEKGSKECIYKLIAFPDKYCVQHGGIQTFLIKRR